MTSPSAHARGVTGGRKPVVGPLKPVMAGITGPSPRTSVWDLVTKQHGVIAIGQLRSFGYTRHAIAQRVARRRLHRLFRGVYAVGRPEVTDFGWWMAAVLACGYSAAISHADAAALWGIRLKRRQAPIQVSVPRSSRSRPAGIVVRRRTSFGRKDVTRQRGIPVTTPACTIVDIATTDSEKRLERAINDADQLGLIRFDVLRAELERMPPKRPGVATVRTLLHRHTFRLTRSELERLFLPIAKRAGPRPARSPLNPPPHRPRGLGGSDEGDPDVLALRLPPPNEQVGEPLGDLPLLLGRAALVPLDGDSRPRSRRAPAGAPARAASWATRR